MRKNVYVLIVSAAFLFIFSCKSDKQKDNSYVKSVFGKVEVKRKNTVNSLGAGDRLFQDDVIITGADGIAVIMFNDGTIQAEIQNNAQLHINDLISDEKKLDLKKGNLWLLTNKLLKGQSLKLKTRGSFAGVRGTRFFSFEFNGMTGTCFCNGQVEYTARGMKKKIDADSDWFSLTRGDKTIIFAPDELKYWRDRMGGGHNHSLLDNSPLGVKGGAPPADLLKKYLKHVEEKFKQ